MIKDSNPYPVLPALRTSDDRQLAIWCKYCRRCHLHGTGGEPRGEGGGHRVAHCHNGNSDYQHTGYILKEVGMLTRENVYRYFDRQRVRGLGPSEYW